MNRRFWSGKRAFVTGHTGFKGGWLCTWLLDAGADVAGYALAPASSPSLFARTGLEAAMHSIEGDVGDRARLESALRSHRPEIVFHLAAQPLVRESYENPILTFATNVQGTANLLEAVRRSDGVRAVVNVTSDKCYEPDAPERRHAETDRLGGHDPYSASKACAELVTAAFRRSFFSSGAGIATARAGNVIGGGDWSKDRLVPDLLAAFAANRPAAIRNPEAVRPWQHVLDPLSGYVSLAERLYDGPGSLAGAWNFGPPPSHEVPVAYIADTAVRLWGNGAAWRRDAGDHPHESAALRLDSDRVARSLGWRARVPIDSAIAWTIEWQRNFAAGRSARDLILADIARFGALRP